MKRFVLFVFALSIFLPSFVFAQDDAKSFYFENYDVDITINENSSMQVVEKTVINFQGSYSYISREIPEQGEMKIENIEVYDEANRRLQDKEISIEDTGYSQIITVNFHAQNETKTWLIKYKVKNAINFFSDYDELYWNVLPDDRPVNVNEVQAIVHLPQPVADTSAFQQQIYSDTYGGTNTLANYSVIDKQTLGFYGLNIPAYYNFTIVAGWPKGIISQPAKFSVTANETADIWVDGHDTFFQTPYDFWIGSDEIMSPGEHQITLKKIGYENYNQKINIFDKQADSLSITLTEKLWHKVAVGILVGLVVLYILSPLFLFCWLLRKWSKTGRDPQGKGTIIPQYEPYQNDPPGVMGTLLDEKADLLDITSSLVDLAVRGYVKIIETEKNKYSLKSLKEGDKRILPYERHLLEYIFNDKKEVAMSDLSQKFYVHIKSIRDEMYQEVLNKNYFERSPQKVRKKYYVWGTISLILGAAGFFMLFLGIPLIVIGIILLIFAGRMPKRTVQGVEALEWALGFKMFLYHAERYRVAKMTPAYFEKCLPYAMVFKVEKEWAEHFKDIYKQPPSWYQGYYSGNLAMWSVVGFTSSLSNSFTPVLKNTLTSMPSSRSGSHWGGAAGGFSGFSGGGFSGGGFGGGGFHAG